MSTVQFSDPNEEAKRQEFVAENRRGLPPFAEAAPSEPTANQATENQTKAQPDEESKRKRFLGLRIT